MTSAACRDHRRVHKSALYVNLVLGQYLHPRRPQPPSHPISIPHQLLHPSLLTLNYISPLLHRSPDLPIRCYKSTMTSQPHRHPRLRDFEISALLHAPRHGADESGDFVYAAGRGLRGERADFEISGCRGERFEVGEKLGVGLVGESGVEEARECAAGWFLGVYAGERCGGFWDKGVGFEKRFGCRLSVL